MSSPILVTGGTGTLGTLAVRRLRAAGADDIRVLSRRHHENQPGLRFATADLRRGEGLEPALRGVDTVLHLAGGRKGDDRIAGNLVRAAEAAGVRHLVFISVIAADQVPVGYMRAKAAAEQVITDSAVPSTVLRAAQFNQLVIKAAAGMAKSPIVPLPGGIKWQPVDADEVASRLVELTLSRPSGRVADLAGPQVLTLREMILDWLSVRGKHRLRVPVRVPGKLGKAYRSGLNLNVDATTGSRTWREFLAEVA